MVDHGYDISDYCAVAPIFGTMKDFEQLVEEAHKRKLKVLIDFVPNHTSDQHPWFKESSASKSSSKNDWYIWRDPKKDGSPPNNWLSLFGGPSWTYHKHKQQYYLHSFSPQQPDLNWDNPKVREAMINNMRFWLKKDVDGFRVDAVSWLSKDQKFRDDPVNPNYKPGLDDPYHQLTHSFSCRGTNLFTYLNEMAKTCLEYGDKFIITEAYPDIQADINHYLHFYGKFEHRNCAPFNFECISLPWDAVKYRNFIDDFQEALLPGLVPIYNLGNHDQPRLATRLKVKIRAKAAAMLLLTLPGMPVIYYGEEIGMKNVLVASSSVKDPNHGFSRLQSRTPLQWSSKQNSGFSKSKPWLPVAKDFKNVNVQSEQVDPKSILNLYKTLLSLRDKRAALTYGSYRSLRTSKQVYGFVREMHHERLTVLLNFSSKEQTVAAKSLRGKVEVSTYMDDHHFSSIYGAILLRPNEGVIIFSSA